VKTAFDGKGGVYPGAQSKKRKSKKKLSRTVVKKGHRVKEEPKKKARCSKRGRPGLSPYQLSAGRLRGNNVTMGVNTHKVRKNIMSFGGKLGIHYRVRRGIGRVCLELKRVC